MASDTTSRSRITIDGRTVEHTQTQLNIIEVDKALADALGLDLVTLSAGVLESRDALRVLRELGLAGDAYIKHSKGKAYLILKGWPAKRPTLKAARYLNTNPKVAHIAVGAKAAAKTALKTTGVVIVAHVALNTVEAILSDGDMNFSQWLGNTASDTLKAAGGMAAGWLAAAVAGALGVTVVGGLVIAVCVGLWVSFELEQVDQKNELTAALIGQIAATIDEAKEPFRALEREYWRWENWLRRGGPYRLY